MENFTKPLEVNTNTFANDYRFLENIDDIVECKKTGKIYEVTYKKFIIELAEIKSTAKAMNKIIKAMNDFKKQLSKGNFY